MLYAILMTEPGGVTPHSILATGASTLDAAQLLMSSRAEEFISEQLELGVDGAEDYVVVNQDGGVAVKSGHQADSADPALISFEAVAITEVV